MVLILLSTPNHTTPFWPSTPRSIDMSPLASPRTPRTPSPSFFAILSPIFTADDNVPATPTLLQVSPGMVPPETPPPWLLAAQSPASTPRPVLSRSVSASSSVTSSTPRATSKLTPLSRPQQRPAFPSTTYSFTAGHAQVFRPPPPLALKRVKTIPAARGPSSPLRQALNASSSQVLPELNAKSSGNETSVNTVDSSCKDSSHDSLSSAEVVTIGMADFDIRSPGLDYESMEIPIALEAPPATPDTGRTITPEIHLANMQAQKARHCRSPSAPLTARKEYFTLSFKPTEPFRSPAPQQQRSIPHQCSMSAANLKQFDKETGGNHIKTRY